MMAAYGEKETAMVMLTGDFLVLFVRLAVFFFFLLF